MKKVLLIILAVIVVIGAGGYLGLRYYVKSLGDQLSLQYDKTPESPHKLVLDTAVFVDDENYDKQLGWLPEATIETIQDKLEAKEVTVQELVKFYGTRIAKLDSQFNAVLRVNKEALSEAALQDRAIENGEGLKPLTGVVVLAKDNIAVKGMSTSAGSFALSELYSTRDAFIIQTLKEQGAIVLGKANLSEFSNFMSLPSSSGYSTLGGQTRNAYGKFDVGGSSSGSSVAASLGMATVTLGSETAGSLVFPASQNSVVAIKPTMGLLSRDLIIPISEAQDTAGVIGRSVADVSSVFSAVLERDMNDSMSQYHDQLSSLGEAVSLSSEALNGKRFVVIDEGDTRMTGIISDLTRLGAEVVQVNFPEKAADINMLPVLTYGILHDLNAFLANKDIVTPLKNLEAIVTFNNEATDRAPFGQFYLEDALKATLSDVDYEILVEKNYQTGLEIIETLLKDHQADAIVSLSNGFSGVYAPARCPAVTVPSGYTESGEPYGVTFVGGLCDDFKLLNFAYGYEQGTLHRKAPVVNAQ